MLDFNNEYFDIPLQMFHVSLIFNAPYSQQQMWVPFPLRLLTIVLFMLAEEKRVRVIASLPENAQLQTIGGGSVSSISYFVQVSGDP